MENLPEFGIVVACDKNRGIGIDNKLPWDLPSDLKFFAEVTKTTSDPDAQNAVIMGRKTWESIPEKHRPLKNRLNIVLTTQTDYELPEGVLIAHSLDEALKLAAEHDCESVFNIGGSQIFTLGLNHPNFKFAYITEIDATFDCDTYLPELPEGFTEVEKYGPHTEKGIAYSFVRYELNEGIS